MSEIQNRLLSLLRSEDRERLARLMETVVLQQGDVIHDVLEPIEHIYFLESGFSSEIAFNSTGEKIEVGCVGSEGFIGSPAVLGVRASPHKSFMETPGSAMRIKTNDMLRVLDESVVTRSLLLRFVHVFMIQVASTALADGRYTVDQRTARWLLMSHDRLEGDELPLTHDFLSLMLGVRRSSVTNALHALEGEHAIKATRARIIVRDRRTLESIAGGSYGTPEQEYSRVFGCVPWPDTAC